MTIRLTAPLSAEAVQKLRAGDRVSLSGVIYAARDAAHARLIAAMDRGDELPFDLAGAVVYYVGPAPAKPGRVIGSAGPTTSGRMDPYTPPLIAAGLRGMIGKGSRSQAVRDAMREHGAVYFAAVGGAGALIARRITRCDVIAYPELGPEAVARLEVQDFGLIVVNDAFGHDLYEQGKAAYRKTNPDKGGLT